MVVKGPGPGGQTAAFTARMEGASEAEQPVYRDVRYNTNGYEIDVPNGVYAVTLKFCEPHYDAAGMRVFGVKVEGQTLAEKLDVFAVAGKNRAHDLRAGAVKVADGRLKIEFPRVVEFPLIAGIVVEGTSGHQPACGRAVPCAASTAGAGRAPAMRPTWPAARKIPRRRTTDHAGGGFLHRLRPREFRRGRGLRGRCHHGLARRHGFPAESFGLAQQPR
ncbi:MAG: malectin domain-containing carbohydrate-binding protein [Kiritimatiellia bacterium]